MKKLTYEQALNELQALVKDLQEDAIGIDELAEKVERATELIEFCRDKLRNTEEKLGGLFNEL